ncbi:NPK1-related protein kinase [Naegleria gruberi]|uniref:NPK1-related protein kinase n=1 Tax=Naegleria gruberi TaxID=5762 RepID=D2V5H2_NAEGR|nr:NPK1-related protein kinase [Naegleria gruberi]EFC47949.1 NPK1-related protein kinase [Naegleria gruberi]|eukprot:XP_002680693.1 NPK1-related protein kinase [Naegleria gruberi strain NEG-M]
MYIFGGITSYQANDGRKASEYIDVLSMYDISQRRWKKPKNKGAAPSARAGHSCCVINRDIYIFGGRQGTILFNDLYKYNVDSEKWSKIQTKGEAPQPSAGHTMSAYMDKIVILGGSDWKKYPTEIYVFHIPSKVWVKCASLGITTGRFWHTATVYEDNLYVYGGGTVELIDDIYSINLRSLNAISEATALTPQSSASPVPLPEMPLQTFASALKFKTIYKAEMRVFAKVPRDVTYLELKETISKSYGFPVVLKYVELDDEKDEITIGSDRELRDFIECFEEMGKGLRLELSEERVESDSDSEIDQEEEIQATTNGTGIMWRKGGLLGKGAYGEVYKGLNVNTGQWMAVKIIDLSATSEKEKSLVEKQILNEVNLMSDLRHDNIVRYLGAEFNRKRTRLFIYIELVDGGSLSEILKNVGKLDESVVRQYTRQILFGLKYLHDKNIIHRDIKGGNILIETKSGTIKLADFGHSKKITENVQASLRICGTPMWMAPEIIKESKYSKASDIWSVACTVIEMLTADVPFPDLVSLENTGVMYRIATGAVPKIPENLSEEGKVFLAKCFNQSPGSRPTVDDLLKEPFLTTLRYVGVSYPNDETSSEEEEEEDDESFPSLDDSDYDEDTNSFDKGKRPLSTGSEESDGMENPNPNNKGKGPLVEEEEDEDEDFTDEDEDEDEEDFSDDESESSSYSEDKSSQSITQQLRNIQANNPILSMGLRGNLPTQAQVAQAAQLRRAPPPLVSTPSTGTLRGVLRNDINQMNPYIAQTVTQVASTPSSTLNIGSSASHSKSVTKSACDNDVMSFLQTKQHNNQ